MKHLTNSLLFFLILTIACKPEENPSSYLFTSLSPEKTGVHFINLNTESEFENIIANDYFYNGGGVALGDINNDGLVDIYLGSNQGENKLYLNQGNFQFKDITTQAGISAQHGWRTGLAMVDINADGYLDIYVCRSASDHPMSRENSLYINNGDLTFSDQAYEYGLNDDSYSTQAAFLDFDRDGDLDMFLLNHSRQQISNSYDITKRNSQERIPYVGNKLYRNDDGKFKDVSDEMGIYGAANNFGLGVTYADLNEDGWLDIYATNDYTGHDKIYLNREGRFFEEKSKQLLTHMSQFSMGVDIADVNNDGRMDILSLDMLPEDNQRQKELHWPDKYDVYQAMVKNGLHHQYMRNMLHLNRGNGTDSLPFFSEIGQLAGVSNTDWSWSALLADYDNDGLQDLFITNGFKRAFTNNDFLVYQADLLAKKKAGKAIDQMEEILSRMPPNEVHNYMFKNTDGLHFSDQSKAWGFDTPNLSQGAAYADLDNDGDLDMVVNQLDGLAGIYRNNSDSASHHYLKVKLIGKRDNTFGLGAKVTIYAQGKKQVRLQNPYRGFQSSMEPTLFFGLSQQTEIDSLHIIWPTGEEQTLRQIKANQTIRLEQAKADLGGKKNKPVSETLLAERPKKIKFRHHENEYNDFKIQSLLTRMYSSAGPALAGADLNQDGLMDLFVGGARGQAGVILIQDEGGNYTTQTQEAFLPYLMSEDVDATFFDMDADGDQDLYVVSGGYEYTANDTLLQDRLYRNVGGGKFEEVDLPELHISGSCVRPADIDQDGDLDLFVGGRIVPGNYPTLPESAILLNDGKGRFTLDQDNYARSLAGLGMVTDAIWLDINQDQREDLIVVGEWMPVKVLINSGQDLSDESEQYFATETDGWWNCLLAADFDADGDQDLLVGNFGMNNQMKASPEHPVALYYDDFDQNGSLDPILTYYISGQSFPSPSRDELIAQSPIFRKRFTNYASYAQATIEDVLTASELQSSKKLLAHTFETTYFENTGSTFQPKRLPAEIQFAPVFALTAADINLDGNLDIISGGNLNKIRARFGKATADFGTVLLGDGKGNFTPMSPTQSGLLIKGEVRKILRDKNALIFGRNDDQPVIYEIKASKPLL